MAVAREGLAAVKKTAGSEIQPLASDDTAMNDLRILKEPPQGNMKIFGQLHAGTKKCLL